MVEEKQIYISFEKQAYKIDKEVLLKCQIDLINLQKKVNHLRAIRSKKKRLLVQIQKNVGKMIGIVSRLDSAMPDSKLPSFVRNKVRKKIEVKEPQALMTQEEQVPEIINNLDRELMDIQERLKKLNG